MWAIAVDAEEDVGGTSPCDGLIMAALGARSIGTCASVLGVGVIFGAQGAGRMFLFADGIVVVKAEAGGAVRSGCRRAEGDNTAWPGE